MPKVNYMLRGGGVKTALVMFGFNHVGIFDKKYERSMWEVSGKLCINGKVRFGHGSRLSVAKDAVLKIGTGFDNSAMMTIVCAHSIHIGDNLLASWNTLIMDTDWHETMDCSTGEKRPHKKPIFIGKNVWLGARSVVLKGVTIADGCVVGAGAVAIGKYNTPNCAIAGNPAKMVLQNITLAK